MTTKTDVSVLNNYAEDINKLFSKVKKSSEFEVDLNMDKTSSINYEKYVSLMEYLTYRKNSKKLESIKTISLDVNYSRIVNDTARENYRITLHGKDIINKYIGLLRTKNNHVIFNTLIEIARRDTDTSSISVYKKTKQMDDTVDIPELNIRVRLADEQPISKKELGQFFKLTDTQQDAVAYRLKQRFSLILESTKDYIIRIDLTSTKTSSYINKLEEISPKYEMELEYFANTEHKPKSLDKILDETTALLKVVQRSNFIITKTVAEHVLDEYKKLLNIADKKQFRLEGRQPVSLELQPAVENLANKYAVTDKADGDRYFLIIVDKRVYLISQNLLVKDTGIQLKKSEYDNTILDGEYIFLSKYQRHLFMVFDCLFAKGVDVRKEEKLLIRLENASKIIDKCFILGKQTGFNPTDLKGNNSPDNLVKHHTAQLDTFIDTLYADIPLERKYPLIRLKYFISATGIAENEVFKYSTVVWNKFMYGKVKYPYTLDGIIYQPLLQAYVTDKKLIKSLDYKWKPSEKNSIDFYVQFAKNSHTGKILDIYDDSREELKDKIYRICYLHVGKSTPEGEVPIYFNENEKLHLAMLVLHDGNVRDVEGNIIQDSTVVEFYYNNDIELNERFRWVPIRTRYDKTEMVSKYRTQYGNNSDVANKIWRSIMSPVRMDDIKLLADDGKYQKHLEEMRGKITAEMRTSLSKENAYYNRVNNLAQTQRKFHNWLKTIMIQTYMSPMYNNGVKLSILDFGIGRGGDVEKYYHAHAAYVVGIDPSYDGLHCVEGAIYRYNKSREKRPDHPKMDFICGDPTVPLNVVDQMAVSSDKSLENKTLIEKFFPDKNMRQFDCINCQFAFHFFLANDKAWNTMCDNINKCLRVGGYMVITTYDAQKVLESFGDGDVFTTYHTENGEKKILTEIKKKFPTGFNPKKIGTGVAIDVYNSISSSEYITEYLVDKDFVTNEFNKKCNMELVDTDLLENQFNIHKEHIFNGMTYDTAFKTRKTFKDVYEFYDQTNEFNKECLKITNLNRMYIFRKR